MRMKNPVSNILLLVFITCCNIRCTHALHLSNYGTRPGDISYSAYFNTTTAEKSENKLYAPAESVTNYVMLSVSPGISRQRHDHDNRWSTLMPLVLKGWINIGFVPHVMVILTQATQHEQNTKDIFSILRKFPMCSYETIIIDDPENCYLNDCENTTSIKEIMYSFPGVSRLVATMEDKFYDKFVVISDMDLIPLKSMRNYMDFRLQKYITGHVSIGHDSIYNFTEYFSGDHNNSLLSVAQRKYFEAMGRESQPRFKASFYLGKGMDFRRILFNIPDINQIMSAHGTDGTVTNELMLTKNIPVSHVKDIFKYIYSNVSIQSVMDSTHIMIRSGLPMRNYDEFLLSRLSYAGQCRSDIDLAYSARIGSSKSILLSGSELASKRPIGLNYTTATKCLSFSESPYPFIQALLPANKWSMYIKLDNIASVHIDDKTWRQEKNGESQLLKTLSAHLKYEE